MLLCLQPRTSQDGVFLLLVFEKNPRWFAMPSWATDGHGRGGGKKAYLLLEASMLVLRSLMSFITGRVQAVAQAFVAHFIARQLFATQDA